jgi:histidinol-phosphatase
MGASKGEFAEDLRLGLSLADLADQISLRDFECSAAVACKADGSPVTQTDIEITERLRNMLGRERPRHQLYSEEDEQATRGSGEAGGWSEGIVWVLDPIDHTRHYARGNPNFACLISLARDGEPVLGVVSAPALGLRWWAVSGGDAYCNGKPIRVRQQTSLNRAYVTVAGVAEWADLGLRDAIYGLCNDSGYPAGSPGGFLDLMYLAQGTIDAFLEPWGKVWDHMAPAFIAQSAGAIVTNLRNGRPIVGPLLGASNEALHREILERLEGLRSCD